MLAHVGGRFDDDALRRPKQVLIAGSFPKQVTQSVVWLNEMGVEIDLIQVRIWAVGGKHVAGFTKLYPLPDVEDFALGPRLTAEAQDSIKRKRAVKAVLVLVRARALPDGTGLRISPSHGTNERIRTLLDTWLAEDPKRGRATWQNRSPRALVWEHDQQPYSPGGLVDTILEQAIGGKLMGIQATHWWVVDSPPGGIDPTLWTDINDKSLVTLANQLRDEAEQAQSGGDEQAGG